MREFSKTGHVSEESLDLYAAGDLREPGQVERHLAACDQCQRRYKDAEELIVLLRMAARH